MDTSRIRTYFDRTRMRTNRRILAGLTVVIATASALAVLTGIGGFKATSASSIKSAAARTTLVVLEDQLSKGLDWDGGASANMQLNEFALNMYDGLVTFATKPTGTGNFRPIYDKFVGRLATSWSNHGNTWTFHLRKGVRSCAGNELTSKDVVFTFARAKSVSGVAPIAWFFSNVANVLGPEVLAKGATAKTKQLKGEVVAAGRYTVKIKTKPNNGQLLPMLSMFGLGIIDSTAAKKAATSKDPWAHAWLDKGGVGFGAYCLKSYQPGTSATLTANSRYYGGQPQFRTVILRAVPQDANRVASIQSGQADIAVNLAPVEFNKIKQSGRASVLGEFNNRNIGLAMNYKIAPWGPRSNKARLIRQAVAYAIPYDEIIKQDYFGAARRWWGLVPSVYPGYVGTPHRYDTNIAKAKSLLAKAGYPNGKGLPAAGLSLTYVAERQSTLQPTATRIRTALARIGISIQLNPIPASEFATRYATSHDMPFYMVDNNVALGPEPGYSIDLLFLPGRLGGLDDSANYDSPTVNRLYLKAKNVQPPRRYTILKPAQETLMTDLPWIPLLESKTQIAVRRGIKGWVLGPNNALTFWGFKGG